MLKTLILGSFLIAGLGHADGFGFNIGPFSLQFGLPSVHGSYGMPVRSILDNPICYAISNRKQLEMTVEGAENVSAKERKIITKRLVVEPYAFGITREGAPVLRGNVVSEKFISEITLKYGEDKFDEETGSAKSNEKGYFSGLFSSDKSRNIDIRKVSDVRVLEDSSFQAPKHYKGVQEDNIKILCQLPVEANT